MAEPDGIRAAMPALLGALPRVPITPDTITQPIIDDWYRRERACREKIRAYEDLLGAIWLYVNWRYVTKQLTTGQKELFADAVDARSRRQADQEGPEYGDPSKAERWWRDPSPEVLAAIDKMREEGHA